MSKQYYQRKPQNNKDLFILKRARAMEIFAYDGDVSNADLARRLSTSSHVISMWREEFKNGLSNR